MITDATGARDEFVSVAEAATVSGIPRRSITRLIERGALTTYATEADRRRRYVRRSELFGLTTLAPAPPLRRRRRREEVATSEEAATAA